MHANANNTVNVPDPIQKRFGYGRYTSSQCAATVRLDCISRIRLPEFVWSILQRRPESGKLGKSGLGPIWMAWSGLGEMDDAFSGCNVMWLSDALLGHSVYGCL